MCKDGFRGLACDLCDAGLTGPDCTKACSFPVGCSGHGRCSGLDGRCICDDGWTGVECEIDLDEPVSPTPAPPSPPPEDTPPPPTPYNPAHFIAGVVGCYRIDGSLIPPALQNEWHFVEIIWDDEAQSFRWQNRAGVSWQLHPETAQSWSCPSRCMVSAGLCRVGQDYAEVTGTDGTACVHGCSMYGWCGLQEVYYQPVAWTVVVAPHQGSIGKLVGMAMRSLRIIACSMQEKRDGTKLG